MRDKRTHIETPDEGPEYLGFADLLNMPFRPVSVGPFNSLQPSYIGEDLSQVDPLAGIKQPGSRVIPVQNVESDLMSLRAELPFLPIMKPPSSGRTAFMPVANTPVDIEVPTGAVLASFGGNVDYFVNFQGRAIRPSATATDVETGTVYKAILEGRLWFVGQLNQLSVVSPSVNAVVQVAYWNYPNAFRGQDI